MGVHRISAKGRAIEKSIIAKSEIVKCAAIGLVRHALFTILVPLFLFFLALFVGLIEPERGVF